MYMNQGEVRQIGIEVISQLNQDFIIDAADFSILDNTRQTIENGIPTIEGHKIIMLFSGQKAGRYNILFTYHVGPEIMKAKIYIEVR